MGGFLNEVRLAARRLAREPGFSVPAVLTVAVGIGIAASVFALVDAVLIQPLPYPEPERLVSVRHEAPGASLTSGRDGISAGIFLHYRDQNQAFEQISVYERIEHTLTDLGAAERVQAILASPELFSVLRVAPQLGRVPDATDWNFDMSEDAGTTGALISHALWVSRYGADPDILGRVVELDGSPRAEIVGVARPDFAFPDREVRMWYIMPQEYVPWSGRANVREAMLLNAVGRLREGFSPAEAGVDLNRLVHLMPEVFPDVTAEQLETFGLRAVVRPFKDEIVGDTRLTLLLLLASGGFLLLVTWANATNLLLARTHGRRIEIGIARALGASEMHITSRLLAESLVLTTTGGLLGLGLTWASVGARFGFAPRQLPRLDEVGVSASVTGLVVILALVSGVLMAVMCLASTRHRAAGPAISALRSRSSTQSREGRTGRRVLVAAQVAIALTLLVGSGLMARTFLRLQQVELGFEPQGALSFYLPTGHIPRGGIHDVTRLHDQVFTALRAVPGVGAVEAASRTVFPLTMAPGAADYQEIVPADADRGDDRIWPRGLAGLATPGYFESMKIPLVAGRSFLAEDTSIEAPGAMISRSLAAELFGERDPIGQRVQFVSFPSWATLTVVGVVGDVPGRTMREGATPVIYLPHVYPPAVAPITGYAPWFESYVVRTERDPASVIPELRAAMQDVDPRLVMVDVATLEEVVAEATAQERFTMRLLLVSAAAALFLGMVGIYGVLAYSVRRRTAEFGIRIALGASPQQVVRQVVRQGAVLCLVGIAVGLVAATSLTGFIATLLYETSPTDPATFVGMSLLLLGVSLVASYLPARRASRVDPAQALRGE